MKKQLATRCRHHTRKRREHTREIDTLYQRHSLADAHNKRHKLRERNERTRDRFDPNAEISRRVEYRNAEIIEPGLYPGFLLVVRFHDDPRLLECRIRSGNDVRVTIHLVDALHQSHCRVAVLTPEQFRKQSRIVEHGFEGLQPLREGFRLVRECVYIHTRRRELLLHVFRQKAPGGEYRHDVSQGDTALGSLFARFVEYLYRGIRLLERYARRLCSHTALLERDFDRRQLGGTRLSRRRHDVHHLRHFAARLHRIGKRYPVLVHRRCEHLGGSFRVSAHRLAQYGDIVPHSFEGVRSFGKFRESCESSSLYDSTLCAAEPPNVFAASRA